MELRGTLRRITVKRNISEDIVQTIVFEVHGDTSGLHQLLDAPLAITVRPE